MDLVGFYTGKEGVESDPKEHLKWLRMAAEQGVPRAEMILGLKYLKGDGVPADAVQGLNWTRRAAEQDAQGRRKLPFFIDPIEHRLKIEKDDLLSVYFNRQVEALKNLRPS